MIRIVIADDHKLIRDAWATILTGERRLRIIGSCGDSAEAVKMCRKLKPEVLLLDLSMPPFDGIEATERIRRLSPATGIIAVTMNNQPAFAKKMLNLGALGYVTKNSPAEELKEAVREVAAGRVYISSDMRGIMDNFQPPKTISSVQLLTDRERQVIELVGQGRSSKEISEFLEISLKTVEVHRYNVLKKLRLKNAAALIHYMKVSAVHL